MLWDSAVRRWVERLETGDKIAPVFERFYDQVLSGHSRLGGLKPRELVAWQIEHMNDPKDRFLILELAQEWLQGQELRYRTKRRYLTCIRSFFMHNRASLPRDPSFRFKADKPAVQGRLELEGFRRILHNSNKMYRAIFLMMFQAGMGENELCYVNTELAEEVLEAVTKNQGVFKLVLPGRKRSRNRRNFVTLLSSRGDWAEAFRVYMRSLPSPIGDVLYVNDFGNPVTDKNIRGYFHWRAVESGVIKQYTPECPECHGETVRVRRWVDEKNRIGYKCKECGYLDWARGRRWRRVRYGVNPHELRDLFRSRWQVSGADSEVAELMMGHEIDPNQYNKFMQYQPWYPIQEYRKALSWLNIVSEQPEKVDRTQVAEELEGQRAEVELLRRELADVKRVLGDPNVMKKLREMADE